MVVLFQTILLCLILFPPLVKSQAWQNVDFELWDTTQHFHEPATWFSNNTQLIHNQTEPLVHRTGNSKKGKYALLLKTATGNSKKGKVSLYQKNFTNRAGVPYNQRPDSIFGFAQYGIPPGDTAELRLTFYINQNQDGKNVLGQVLIKFFDSATNYHRFSAPIRWFSPFDDPDTLSGHIMASKGEKSNGYFMLDNLHFKKRQKLLPFPNGNFENWELIQSENPKHWFSLNTLTLKSPDRLIEKTHESHSGQYGALLKNAFTYRENLIGFMEKRISLKNAKGIPDSLTGYYQYYPRGNDSALAGYVLLDHKPGKGQSTLLRSNLRKLGPSSTYKNFTLPIQHNFDPKADSLYLLFSAGHLNGLIQGTKDSKLYLDGLSWHFRDHLSNSEKGNDDIKIYPNPARNYLNLNFESNTPENLKLSDCKGRLVKKINLSSKAIKREGTYSIPIYDLAPGTYFLRSGERVEKIVIQP